jgi:hypothetical protein
MRYMLLIHSPESYYATLTQEQMGQLMAGYGKFHQELEAAGVLRASDRLQPTHAATTVRVRNGKTGTTDGPFAETKEAFGGYYLIDVANLDEAVAWAAKIPTAKYGSVEVRPIWEPEDYM